MRDLFAAEIRAMRQGLAIAPKKRKPITYRELVTISLMFANAKCRDLMRGRKR